MLQQSIRRAPPHVRRPPRRLQITATRVVLAETDVGRRRRTARLLRWAGYQVIEVESGAEILEHLDLQLTDAGPMAGVDVIVSNVAMPDASGLEILRDIRSVDWATAVILIDDDADPATLATARRLGAATVLGAPWGDETVVDAVRSVAPPGA